MNNWPQYTIIALFVVRWVLQTAGDLEKETPGKVFLGLVMSVIANAIPLWVLDMGGFFDKL
mgnify:CR=1 FL=1